MVLLSHRHGWLPAVLLALFPCLVFAGRSSDPPPTSYHASASEVRLAFFATDQNNRLVETLSPDDFAVVDGGMVIRDFRSLARSDETALDIVALVDTSESVAPRFHANMEHVLRLAPATPTNPGDDISIVTFSGVQPAVVCSGDCRSATAKQKLLTIQAAGPTPLYDALTYTARFVSRRRTPGVREVLILFSDGNDTISRASLREALDAVMASGALLYTVNLDSSHSPSSGGFALQQMAEATGGRSFSVHNNTSDVLQAVLADLRASYVVTYQLPSHAAGFHSLRILPKHNLHLRFYSRRGYYYEEVH